MNASGQTVCLCMIVKDEAHVIARCLASVRPILDRWIVVDTGSTDGTQDLVRAAMAGLPGEVVERPWVDFAHNRSEALALARPHADYSFVIDADDELVLEPGYALPPLDADVYSVDIRYGATAYRRPQLVRNALEWRYRGVLHEFLECPGAKPGSHLPILMKINHDGARSKDTTTYAKDAAILERALETESDPFLVSRYTFYLAQSWRDCGEREKALDAYLRRAGQGHWAEEVFVALLQAARLKEALGHPDDDIIGAYARAAYMAPTRAEALHGASRFCRAKDRFEDGYWWAKRGLGLTVPSAGLFVETWVYEYGLLDELGVHAYWSGRYEESRDACDRLLREGKMPAHMRERIEANRRFSIERSGSSQTGASPRATGETARAPLRCAVVTPYFKEDAAVLARCVESVRAQTTSADHFVVADGHPMEWLDAEGVRHIRLDTAHADFGGTPRAIGGLLAVSEGYDVIAFLDADNFLEPDHLERCLAAADAASGECDYVVARLRVVRPDGSTMNLAAENIEHHVDTSCFVLLRGAFHAIPLWASMSKAAAAIGDRIFYRALRDMKLRRAVNDTITVNYTSLWESHYRLLGEEPPPGAKPNAVGPMEVPAWSGPLAPGALREVERRAGLGRGKTIVASIYAANAPDQVVDVQRRVVQHLLPADMTFTQIKADCPHHEALDHLLQTTDAEVVIILDIDCVPLHDGALADLAASASDDVLVGCVQRANHIDNGGHLYVGPFCMALSKRLWEELGRPSFAPTQRGEVGEELTYLCEARGKSVRLIWPSRVGSDAWDLSRWTRFGFNTEYGNSFVCCFGLRDAGQAGQFMSKCENILK